MSNILPNHNLISGYLYKKPLETIWKIVKDTSSLNNILSTLKPNFASEPVLLNSNNTYEKDASFFFYINKQYKLLYKVIDLIETDYYCKITCKIISSINKFESLSKSVHCHYLSPDSTYLIYERSCQIPNVSKEESEKMKRHEEATSANFLKYIDQSIDTNFHLKTQCEGRRFNVNVNTLIKELYRFDHDSFLVTNGFQCSHFPIIPGVTIGLRVKNKNYPDRYFKYSLIIESISCNSRGLNAKVNMIDKDNSNGSQKNGSNNETDIFMSNRFLIVDIIMINHEETYYSLRHCFNEAVREKVLEFVSQNKVQYFKKLSHYLEKKTNH